MRINLKYNIVGLALLILFSVGCDKDQIVEEPISTDRYPVATFTTDFTGSEVNEGDTIKYTITLDKMLDRALTFTLKSLDNNTTEDGVDFTWETVVIPPYSKEAKFDIIFTADNFPENTETFNMELGVFGIADKNLLNPKTVNPVLNLKVNNVNDANGLTVALSWPNHDDDWDAYIIDENGTGIDAFGNTYDWVGYGGATGNDPEIMIMDMAPYWDIPDGVYYLDVDPWDVSEDITNFNIAVGYPDGNVESFDITFDMSSTGSYSTVWGYSTMKIVVAGSNYTVSLVPPFDGSKSLNNNYVLRTKEFFNSTRNIEKLK